MTAPPIPIARLPTLKDAPGDRSAMFCPPERAANNPVPIFPPTPIDASLPVPPATPPAPRPCFFGAEAPHRGQNPARSSTVEAANFTFSRGWAIIASPRRPLRPRHPNPLPDPFGAWNPYTSARFSLFVSGVP